MDFRETAVRDLQALGEGLGGMGRLETLSLDFSYCKLLASLDGFEALGGLAELQKLAVNLSWSAVRDVGALGVGLVGIMLCCVIL